MTDFQIDGVVSVPNTVSQEQFETAFLAWVDSKGWSFGGGIGPVVEPAYLIQGNILVGRRDDVKTTPTVVA